MFAILQKYDFSSKSQRVQHLGRHARRCLRYCKSTIFQANHNTSWPLQPHQSVVCDTAKVRFFKQITTKAEKELIRAKLFAILQKYDFSSKSQPYNRWTNEPMCCLRYCKSTIFQANHNHKHVTPLYLLVVCDTAKVRFFKQITTLCALALQIVCCLRYCKSTIFQANHNNYEYNRFLRVVVCDTAKVRFFKQITTRTTGIRPRTMLFAILQKYDFSSKSQLVRWKSSLFKRCLRYCKSTIFQANHNNAASGTFSKCVVCDTAKVRFFKQITTQND